MNGAGGVSVEVESPIGAYLWRCGHCRCRRLRRGSLQEWDYLHADEMTDAQRRTLIAWAVSVDIFSAPDTGPRPQH